MGVTQKVKIEKVGKTDFLNTDSLSMKFNSFWTLKVTMLIYNFENIHIGLQACFDKKSSVGGALVL